MRDLDTADTATGPAPSATSASDAPDTTNAVAPRSPDGIPRTRPPEEAPWVAALAKDKKGNLKASFSNVCALLRGDTEFGSFALNERSQCVEFNGRPVDPHRELRLREEIETRWNLSIGSQMFNDALSCVAGGRTHDPVRDELKALAWDGAPRLDSLARRVLGNHGEAEAVMVRKWMIAAVARAMQPGCKADAMLVLQGSEQGRFKSTFFAVLGGEHFTDSVQDFEKDGLLAAHRSWIIELGELDGITRKSDVERIKNVLSRRADDIRRPYGRTVETLRRSFVYCGTVNSSEFLHDATGNRRFWCVEVPGAVDIATLAAAREQLWAEAVEAYRAGEPWWLSAEQAERAETVAQRFTASDAWDEKVKLWLRGATGEVTVRRVLVEALGFEDSRIDRSAQIRAGAALQRLGFERFDVRDGDGKRRVYRRRDERVRVDAAGESDRDESDGANEAHPNVTPETATLGQVGTFESRTQTAVVPIIPIIPINSKRVVGVGVQRGSAQPETRAESLGAIFGDIGTDESASENAGDRVSQSPRTIPGYVGVGSLAPLTDADELNDLHGPN
jgi:putative DNA primase/helicase